MSAATRSDALLWAQHVRDVRQLVEVALGDGSATLADVMDRRHDDALGSVHLLTALEALPGASKVGTRRALAAMDIAERTPLAELDDATVARIVEAFPLGTSR